MRFKNVRLRDVLIVVVAVIMMGFTISFLNRCAFGSDSYTVANLGISSKLRKISDFWTLGMWQATLNVAILAGIMLFDRSQIGWGTIANMFLVGFSFDFFTKVEDKLLPSSILREDGVFSSMTIRIAVVIPMLILFIFSAAVYMTMQLGTSPYDAIPYLICKHNEKIPFRPLRIAYDSAFAVIGLIYGQKLGFVTIAMCICLGPAITWVHDNVIVKIVKKNEKDSNGE